jgi:hypothetical protein
MAKRKNIMKFEKAGIKIINRIFIVLLCFFLFSCKLETSRNNIPKKDVVVRIQLEDTILLKDTIFGVVNYESVFDTIKLKRDEKRYVFLYLRKTKCLTKNFEDFLTKDRDTFVALEDGSNIIPIYDLKFDTTGEYFLEGYIIDELWLKNMRVSKGDDKIKVPRIGTKIIHPIYIK